MADLVAQIVKAFNGFGAVWCYRKHEANGDSLDMKVNALTHNIFGRVLHSPLHDVVKDTRFAP